MDQNTAQNDNQNVQFNYPDFSGNNNSNPAGNQNVQGQQQQQVQDDPKVDELKKNLQRLIDEEANTSQEVVNQGESEGSAPQEPVIPPLPESPVQTPPSPEPIPSSPVPTEQIKKEEPLEPSINKDQVVQEEAYVQQPTELPNLEKEDEKRLEEVINTPPPPSGDNFDPLPSDLPKFREALDNVMPEPKKAKEVQEPEELLEEEVVQPKVDRKKDLRDVEPKVQQNSGTNDAIEFESNGDLTMEKLLAEATNRNASDLHISVGYPPIIRVDGELVSLEENVLSPEKVEELVFSVLTDERKELLEVNREIDFAYSYEGSKGARFRVNAYYTMKNIAAAFRLIPTRIKTIEELMLPQMYHQFAKLKQGLILVTGPTGHGKSTTLAAILEDINRTRFCHVVTIEDPIEYVFEGKKALIDQREMNDDTHSWKIALRSVMRQDPDVILVGEMRDFETIASAITLAETGHLVFATLHTNSASQTLDRIIDVFPENQQQQVRTQVANTLQGVIAQRLIPLEKGGRRAVSEIMLNNSAVKNLIREGKMHQVDNVIRTSADIGMVYLEKSLVGLVREGVITVQTAQEYAVHPEEVLRLLKS
jgi:twitching motility protein PilT